MKKLQYFKVSALAACVATVSYAIMAMLFGTGPLTRTAYAQDRYLETRINQIEQRFVLIDSR
ncbi:MAG: hypothetical protein AB7J13_07755, partial [Pyrinomonadaceae bacterium]